MMQQLTAISPEERHWLLVAVAQILIADHIYENSEKDFFENIMSQIFKKDAKEVSAAVKIAVELKTILEGEPATPIETFNIINPSRLVFFLDILSAAVYASGKMLHSESLKFYEAGLCLGLDPGTLSYRLNLERERVLAQQKLDSFRHKLTEDIKKTTTGRSKISGYC
ncbi:MAG: hypothetical protein QNL04_01535 [SAR324 cluster bacterium]|nr:hypothetical protein [SAR324 cluster bacterium]